MSQIENSIEEENKIVKNIHKISTQIENIRSTRIDTERIMTVLESANAKVRDMDAELQKKVNDLNSEVSTDSEHNDILKKLDDFQNIKEKLEYWESKYLFILAIIGEWNEAYQRLYDAYTELQPEATADTESLSVDVNELIERSQQSRDSLKSYIETLKESKCQYESVVKERDEYKAENDRLTTELAKVTEKLSTAKQCWGHYKNLSDKQESLYRNCESELSKVRKDLKERTVELEQVTKQLSDKEYEYKAVSYNLEKVNAECATWKDRYTVTKKLLDAETSKVTTETTKQPLTEREALKIRLEASEQVCDVLNQKIKLLTDTKTSLVNELLDLKHLVHKLYLNDATEQTISDKTTKQDVLELPAETVAALSQERVNTIMQYSDKEAKAELAKLHVQCEDWKVMYQKLQDECELLKRRNVALRNNRDAIANSIKALAEQAGFTVRDVCATAFDGSGVEK